MATYPVTDTGDLNLHPGPPGLGQRSRPVVLPILSQGMNPRVYDFTNNYLTRSQETLAQCCLNAGPPSATLAQH